MPSNDNAANSTAINQKSLEELNARLMRSTGDVQSCYEGTRALVRTIINAMCMDEMTEQDLSSVVALLIQVELYTEIGYTRYLIESAKA